MANVIVGYDPYTVNSQVFSQMSDDSGVMESLKRRYGDATRPAMEAARKIYERVTDSKAYRRSLAATRKVRNLRNEDTITELHRIDMMQHAPRYMQEYMMTSEVLAGRYNRGGMHAWENGFAKRNKTANASGTNIWFRELNDGSVRKDKDGYFVTQFFDRHNHRALTTDKKIDIRLSIGHLEDAVLAGGEDWSSEHCEII